MNTIRNPILRGFNPDPSILRTGDDYYIATSTFEWFPGVQIHHSRDLIHWRLLTHPLNRTSQLNMIGNPNSGGVWAPALSHDGERFYLVYTDVKSLAGAYKDTPNYLVTADAIEGPWSEPVYLNSSGFDPSLFHDDDGRKWLVNMVWDHRKGKNPFHGIVIQEYSPGERRLVGPVRRLFGGTQLGCTEGPHLYKKDGWYYLLTAEGGTGYEHAVTMARSRTLFGPYEVDPRNPVLTSKGKPGTRLQKAGHGSLVETQTGEWYLAHLCARPVNESLRCSLGRETALQRCCWTEDGWLRVAAEDGSPQDEVEAPKLRSHPFPAPPARDDFDGIRLDARYSTLREPADESWVTLRERPGFLRMRGRESLNSCHRQSLVARRLESHVAVAETCVAFEPESFQQMAGLIAYYNTDNHYYLQVTHDEEAGRCLNLIATLQGRYDEALDAPVPLGWKEAVYLRAAFGHGRLQFAYSADGTDWTDIGPELDASLLSDESATVFRDGYFASWGFTGTFVGLCVQDLTGRRLPADFDYFTLSFAEG